MDGSNCRRVIDTSDFAGISVYSQATGRTVPVSQVATPEIVWQPGKIARRDRLKTVTVSALLDPGFTAADVNNLLAPWLEDQAESWPFGYFWEFGRSPANRHFS